MLDGVRLAAFPAVDPDVASIIVSVESIGGDNPVELALPVDRSRARPHERLAIHLPEPVAIDDVLVRVVGAAVGLLVASIDIEVTTENQAVAAVSLGLRMSRFTHPRRSAGSGPLWRDWHPPEAEYSTTGTLTSASGRDRAGAGSVRGVAGSAWPDAIATRASEASQRGAWTAPPRAGWRVRAVPAYEELGVDCLHTPGGPVAEAVSERWTLRFDTPLAATDALDLDLEELFVFRTGTTEFVSVPAPQPDGPVDLTQFVLSCGSERVNLIRWEAIERRGFALLLSAAPSARPDVRVDADDSTASLWLSPSAGPTLVAALPESYAELFARNEIPLAVRMVGKALEVPVITVPLAAVGSDG